MKELTVTIWCDGHDERVPAIRQDVDVMIDGQRTLVDVCAECERVIEAAKTLAARGTPPVPPKRGPSGGRPAKEGPGVNTTCPICGFVSSTRGALGQHLAFKHQSSIRKANA